MKASPQYILALLLFALCQLSLYGQKDDQATAEEIVKYCIKHKNTKLGSGQCTELIFHALSSVNKSIYKDTRKIVFLEEALRPGDIIHLEWHENSKPKQHYMIVMEVKDESNVIVAHQNFNYQLKVVYTNYDLAYFTNQQERKVSIYRMIKLP